MKKIALIMGVLLISLALLLSGCNSEPATTTTAV
jgi:predicted small secreted protein